MRTALVTGASRGIGRGVALSLARQGFGLTITSRSPDDLDELSQDLISAGAGDVAHLAVDIADRESLPSLVDLHKGRFGSMDALVLNAGVGSAGDVSSYRIDRLEKTVQVNFTSAMLLIQYAIPLLREGAVLHPKQGAKIVGLSSITGVYAEAGLAVYGATKAALLSLIETVNLEESPRGVTATAIAPGYVATDMSAWITDRVPAETMIPVDDVVRVIDMVLALSPRSSITRIVMGRSGTTGYSA